MTSLTLGRFPFFLLRLNMKNFDFRYGHFSDFEFSLEDF